MKLPGRDTVLFVVLAALIVYQVIERLPRSGGQAGSGRYIDVKEGSAILDSVVVSGRPLPLSEVEGGACRLVVIYSPTCGASVASATQWANATPGSRGKLIPDDWKALWISIDPSGAEDPVAKLTMPATTGRSLVAGGLVSSLSIRAFPVFITLDRAGRVTGSSVGAPLPAYERLTTTCEIVPERAS